MVAEPTGHRSRRGYEISDAQVVAVKAALQVIDSAPSASAPYIEGDGDDADASWGPVVVCPVVSQAGFKRWLEAHDGVLRRWTFEPFADDSGNGRLLVYSLPTFVHERTACRIGNYAKTRVMRIGNNMDLIETLEGAGNPTCYINGVGYEPDFTLTPVGLVVGGDVFAAAGRSPFPNFVVEIALKNESLPRLNAKLHQWIGPATSVQVAIGVKIFASTRRLAIMHLRNMPTITREFGIARAQPPRRAPAAPPAFGFPIHMLYHGVPLPAALVGHENDLIDRARTDIAPAINGGTCQLTDTDSTCTQNCAVSDWSVPGECILSGAYAGKQRSTRTVTKKQCNGGASCPDNLEGFTDCDVDCDLSDWSEWSSCDLKTQQQTRTRSVFQQAYNGGAACDTLVDYQGCGSCADIVSDFTYSECDATTGLRTGTATYLYPPQNGLTCNLVVQDTCSGELAGKVVSTRSILTPPLNGGRQCEDFSKHDTCVVDCLPGDTWGAWSDCSAQGFSRRTINIDYPAQNGGRNDECLVEEQKTCSVDCAIDPASGEITQPSLNGRATCQEFATAHDIDGNYPEYSTTSSISFMTMLASNKSYALAAAASGGGRHGYNSISRQAV
ncbi:hypothetical protein SDRG_05688 [Saprolegnia diclina VS20]|uniref:Spondin domain-containing protein n=1 Tax=Saprolegnia diclina (strain VS20) TaxID=1156394 RepID=T0RWH1_SAPDV|nr:hypothetical protein SDRG_05688 [Saprolegnia diclina VS20]EQC36858.1 hypothetical protein SDRG_05688 [Saprolegnia diclina VS20]|eukprot:XP_008609639.1 hypothetical protein SDRG_05688 [Saprolegnia diclina VS20]